MSEPIQEVPAVVCGIQTAAVERRVAVESTFNLRDIGGYPVGDDRMTAWAQIYRSDFPGPSVDVRGEMSDLGLRTVIDLRSDGERRARASVPGLGGVRVLDRPVGISDLLNAEPELGRSLGGLYAAALQRLGPQIAAAVSAFLEPESLPALVHCTAGKDRTGLVIGLLLSSFGVADDVVAADYALTADLLTAEFFAGVDPTHVFPDGQVDLTPLHRADASAMLDTLAVVRELAGSAEEYLVWNGVDAEGLQRLRQAMVVPRP